MEPYFFINKAKFLYDTKYLGLYTAGYRFLYNNSNAHDLTES